MSSRFASLIILPVLVVAVGATAQVGPPTSATTGQGMGNARPTRQDEMTPADEDASVIEKRAPIPAMVNGNLTSLSFSSELDRTNYLSGGVTVGATYDDNVLSTTTNPQGGYTASVLPYIALDQSRARLHWDLDYAAGFVTNQRLSQQNQQAHNAGAALEYRLSPHVDLRLSDHFVYTTSFFDLLQTNSGFPGSGTVQQPNQSVITPLATRISNLATAQMTYQYSPNDMVGGSGTFFTSRYRDVPPGATALLDSDTQQADGFYTHRVTRSTWIGGAYEFQNLSFSPGIDQAETHSFLLFSTFNLRPRMSFSIFGGPERWDYSSQIITQIVSSPVVVVVATPTSRQEWTYMAGAGFNWQGARTSVQAGASRRTSDGGGLLGPVELVTLEAAVRQKLTRSTVLALGAIAGDNRLLANFNNVPDRLRSASGNLALEQTIAKSFVLTLGYGRDYQRQSGGTPLPSDVDHNRGWVTLTYSFSRAIGR